ncbi:MAG: hypothetical protein SOW67_00925, partial [Fusobacterium necrophorum]|nr:hypothetical protein [Fusobacterium necrophorum]
MNHNLEKSLKRWLKRKISVSLAVIVVFVITGSVGFAEGELDINLNESTFVNSFGNFKDAKAETVATYFNKTNTQVNQNTKTIKDLEKLKVDLNDVAKLSKENKFTANNDFSGGENIHFKVSIKGKAKDYKTKEYLEMEESTVEHSITSVGSYTRADGKKKIHNAIMQREKLESMEEKDQIVFHTLDDTGSHLVARGAKKINGQNGQDSSVTIHSKIFDENNKEIASQTLKHDGIHTVVQQKNPNDSKDSYVISNQVKNSIYSNMTSQGMETIGEKGKFIKQEIKDSVISRLNDDGSSVIAEKEKKIFNQVKDSVQLSLDKNGSYTTAQEGKNIVSKVDKSIQHRLTKDGSSLIAEEGKSIASEVKNGAVHKLSNEGVFTKAHKGKKIISEVADGAKLVMDETASKFTKDLYVGNNVWKDTSAIGNQLVIGNQSNEAKKKDSIAIGFDNSVISEGALALGKNNVISGQGSVIIGDSNDVSGKKSLALGASNSVLRKRSLAVGSDNLVDAEESGVFGIGEATVNSNGTVTHKYRNEGKGSYAFGNFNSIAKGTENNFILGNKVKIEEGINNSVVLGNESTARKATKEEKGIVGNIEFGGFAGQGKPENGVVSVGAEGKERQIINVAAGKVAEDSTDAINGSQLFSVAQKLTDTGLNFQGNDEQKVQRKLGQTLTLKGEGVSKEQSAKFKGASGNINVKNSKEDGSLELQLAKDLKNIDTISNGNTKITLTTTALGKPTIDINNARIQNVAAGVYNTDAVNVGQLKKSEGTLTNLGLNFMGNTLMPVHRDLGQTLIIKGEGVNPIQAPFFKSASGNINVHALGSLLFGNYGLEIQLAKDLQNIESISNKKTKIALLKDSIAMNQALHMGDSNTQHQIKYVADGTDLTDAVNLKQLKEYNTELEKKGLNFAG